MKDIDARLKKIFMEKYEIEITNENEKTFLDLLGIDSLNLVNLILYIEEEFDFDFYSINIDLMKLKTYESIKNIIESNLKVVS